MKDTQLVARYRNWLQATPQAFVLFEKLSNQIKAAGKTKYSAWTIIGIMRWESDLSQTEEYKISNDYIGLLARDLIAKDKSFEGFFNLKKTKRY